METLGISNYSYFLSSIMKYEHDDEYMDWTIDRIFEQNIQQPSQNEAAAHGQPSRVSLSYAGEQPPQQPDVSPYYQYYPNSQGPSNANTNSPVQIHNQNPSHNPSMNVMGLLLPTYTGHAPPTYWKGTVPDSSDNMIPGVEDSQFVSPPRPHTMVQRIQHPPVHENLTNFPYPDITSMVNANSNIAAPMVESQFVDRTICTVCGKKITSDMIRHLRIHHTEPRFKCKFPKSQCNHKTQRFNRPYDFKKHLLNRHFVFDDKEVKKFHNLSNKLSQWGVCQCGKRFISDDWLDSHILTNDQTKLCPCLHQN